MASVDQAKSQAEVAAAALDKAAAVRAEAKRGEGETIWMPNAIGVKARPFVEARTRMNRKQKDVFDHPETLIKDPKPGWHYGWARLNQPVTVMRAGAGLYKYIHPNEVRADLAQMFTTHKGTTGEQVCYGGLVLIGITDEGWIECYVEPEIESVARMATQQQEFMAGIEQQSEGKAVGSIEHKVERD